MPDDDALEGAADAGLAAWLAAVRAADGPPARELGATALRELSAGRARSRPRGPELPVVEHLRSPSGELGARLYRPALDPRPLIVFLHGGMWLMCDLDTHDRTCRRLAAAAGAAVLALDYRRGPEAPWPAAVDDAVTDLTLSQPSIEAKGTGWGLDAEDLAWAVGQWLPENIDAGDPRVSPLFAPNLAGLPATLIVTAEHDPLRDEGDAFAAALAAAGTPVRHRCEPGMVHGFLQGLDLDSPAAQAATDRFFADARELVCGRLPSGGI